MPVPATLDPVRVSSLERWLARGLALASAALGAAGAVSWTAGGGVFRIGAVTIGLQRPERAVALGVALLLLREVLGERPAAASGWRTGALVALLAGLVAADSSTRLVGDGHEYVAMATNLSAARPPALTDAECRRVEAAWSLAQGALDGRANDLVGADGRHDFLHFWAYPLLAAPFVAAAAAAFASPLAGFTVANVLLLAGAAVVVARWAGRGAAAVLFASPVLWWVDKAHPEVLLFAAVAASVALAAEQAPAALLVAAVPAAQNLAFVPVLAVATAWAWLRQPRSRWLLASTVGAWALASLNPLYYLHRLGRPFPLRGTTYPHVPGAAELWAVLGDTNIGLGPGWPAVGLVALGAAAWGLTLLLRRSRRPAADVLALGAAAVSLVVLSTQAANVNHGGTRGMSRYALWLAPLAVPALAALGRHAGGRSRVALLALGALSVVSFYPDYLPAKAERYLSPSPLARWLWTRHPGVDRPLPEIFAERTWGREFSYRPEGQEPPGVLPAATARCEKALVRGDGTPVGTWPLQCAPVEKPEACRRAWVICYADAGPSGARFSTAPFQPAFRDDDLRRWYWGGAPDAALVRDMAAVPWAEMGLVDPADEDYFLVARHGVGRIQLLTTQGAFAAWFDRRRKDDAWVEPRVHAPSSAWFVDPMAGRELARARLLPGAPVRLPLPAASPLFLVVVEDE